MADDSFALGYAMGNDSNNGSNNCGNGGMWGDNGWWAIILFAMIFGWGNGGWGGGFGGNGSGLQGVFATQADIQRGFDTSTIIGKLDGISNGICDSTFALNNTIVNGFNGVQRDMCTGFTNVASGLTENRFAAQQGFCNLSSQLASCCCETQRQIERGFCDTNYNLATNTTSIIQNAHNDTDRVIAKLDAMEMSRKDETIFALREKLSAADLAASQAAQNNYLISQLRPCPVPAYITCSPFASAYGIGYGQGNCGCNSCGC